MLYELVARALRSIASVSGVAAKGGSYALAIGAVILILHGVQCSLTHLQAGDFVAHAEECLSQIVAGAAYFSPGLAKLKIGPLKRPD